jgi:hypothetical protein
MESPSSNTVLRSAAAKRETVIVDITTKQKIFFMALSVKAFLICRRKPVACATTRQALNRFIISNTVCKI